MNIKTYFQKKIKTIDKALDRCLPKIKERPSALHEAMRYAVFSGGKRIRPIFALAACEAVGGDPKKVLPAACAIELIHSYSLVHDDLPCMDDDDERRGKPTCHKKYGEATALLVGDALLTLAFQLLSDPGAGKGNAEKKLRALHEIALAAGTRGMVGGQAVDMEFQDKETDLPTMQYINVHKSGDLIAVSTKVGAYLGGGTPRQVESLYRYGQYAGLLFQIVDDILDREGYARILGIQEARREAETLTLKAKRELQPFGAGSRVLSAIADFVLVRTY